MKWQTVKTALAAFGAFFIIMIVLAALIGAFSTKSALTGDKVAVVKLEGVILDPSELSEEFERIEDREDIKAVVVRIDSPGGAVGPSQEIHGWIKRLRKKKKVVASMGSIAASGGLYAAVAAEKIVANPGTITGSIGVIIEFINAEELLTKIGLKGYVVKTGRFKDTGSPLRQMEEDEKKLLQSVIDDVNSQFINAVAEGRGMKPEDVQAIADGRILSGSQAKGLGLVDTLGDLKDAIDLGAKLAGIEGEPVVLYPEKKAINFWKALFGAPAGSLTELLSGTRIMYLSPNK